jgi:hypothetical protein
MNSEQIKDMHLLYNAVYNEDLREQFDEYINTIYDEDIVEVATEYFYSYGLNEDGIDILIEKIGLESFVEYVYDLSEDLHVLTEARRARRRTGGKSYEDVKAEIDAKEAKARAKSEAKKNASKAASKKIEVERNEPESRGVESQAKAEQPKSKKPVRDAIARNIFRAVDAYKAGMERHKAATATASRLAGETAKTVGKVISTTHEAGRRAGEHVKKHGLKSLANEEVDFFDFVLEYLVAEGYADTNENALVIMTNMSEEWKQSIAEGMGLSVGASKLAGNVFSNARTSPEQGARNFQKNVADPVGHAVKGAVKSVLGIGDEKNKQMMQKRRPN